MFKRVAVLRLEPDSVKGYVVLDWQRGALHRRRPRSKLSD